MLRSFPGGKIATGCGLFRTQMKCSFHLKFPFVCLSCWGPYYLCWDLHDLRLVRFCWCCREYLYLPFWQLFLLLLQVGWHTTFCHSCIIFWCPHLDFGAWHVHHSFVLACVSFLCALVLALLTFSFILRLSSTLCHVVSDIHPFFSLIFSSRTSWCVFLMISLPAVQSRAVYSSWYSQ